MKTSAVWDEWRPKSAYFRSILNGFVRLQQHDRSIFIIGPEDEAFTHEICDLFGWKINDGSYLSADEH